MENLSEKKNQVKTITKAFNTKIKTKSKAEKKIYWHKITCKIWVKNQKKTEVKKNHNSI